MPTEADITDVVDKGLADLEAGEANATCRMLTTYEQAYHAAQRDLDDVLELISRAQADGVDVNPDWLRRQNRYLDLMGQIDQQYREAAVRAGIIVEGLQAEGAQMGAGLGEQELRLVLPDAPTGVLQGVSVPQQALRRWASATSPDSPLRPVLGQFGPSTAGIIEEAITEGMANGYGVDRIRRNIEQRAGMQGRRFEVERIVRTEAMRAYRGGLNDQFAQVADLLEGLTWLAALDQRTCLFCLSRHGTLYPVGQFPDDQHPSCRCVPSPKPRQVYGQPVQYTSGEDFVRSQPVATQRAMVGGGDAFAAWQRGDLHIGDFAGLSYDPVWGYSGFQRSGRAALLHAGLA